MFGAELPQSIYPMVPGYAQFQLLKKTAMGDPDTYAAAATVNGRKRAATGQEIMLSRVQTEDPLYMISIFDIGEEGFVAPDVEDIIVGPDNVKYRVRSVSGKVLDTLFPCIASKLRDQS